MLGVLFVSFFLPRLFFSRSGNKLQPHFRRMEMKSWRLGPWGARPPTSTRRWRNFPKRSWSVLGSILINAHWLWRLLLGLLEFVIFALSCEDVLHRFPALLFSQIDTILSLHSLLRHPLFHLVWTPRQAGVQAKWSVARQGRFLCEIEQEHLQRLSWLHVIFSSYVKMHKWMLTASFGDLLQTTLERTCL